MKWKNTLTKFLAIAGTVFVWFPILAPVFFSIVSLIGDGRFRFDYLMPAELFPVILAGWILLIWAAVRTHSRLKFIAWGAGAAAAVIVIGMVLTRVTGLATGERELAGGLSVMFAAIFILFWLAIIATGVGGILLLRDLFRVPRVPISPE
jgi:hypothetical protein